ncbi:MAG: hypothetical protein POG74_12425 [Acidocella sp.]|nr:hypothetical protein [Acidocella sp.]
MYDFVNIACVAGIIGKNLKFLVWGADFIFRLSGWREIGEVFGTNMKRVYFETLSGFVMIGKLG